MDNNERTRLDAMFNLLADEVVRRLEERFVPKRLEPESPQVALAILDTVSVPEEPSPVASELTDELVTEPNPESVPDPAAPAPAHTTILMARLALGVLFIVMLINIPFNTQGMALARSIPSSASLIIADGLLVKEDTSPDVWVYREGAFHWITSLEAFEYYGYRWQDVHIVEPGFLGEFEQGSPLYLLMKCGSSPHIYRLEAGKKRWIVDIPTFEAEGYLWRDVKSVPCGYLQSWRDGDSIPPGQGSPPAP